MGGGTLVVDGGAVLSEIDTSRTAGRGARGRCVELVNGEEGATAFDCRKAGDAGVNA